MRSWVWIPLALSVMSAWLGCLGFLKLREPLDRLHCVTFCNVVGGFMLVVASLSSDGFTSRSLKIALIWVVCLAAGAATSHATGRALTARGEGGVKLLIAMMLILLAISGTAVVLAPTPQRQIFAMGANGLVLAMVFMVLQAPDVAFAELIIGAVALPLMFFVVLASTKMDRKPRALSAAESVPDSEP